MNINELKTPEDLAVEWNLSLRRVQVMFKEGQIEGAVKKGNQWLAPNDVKRPARRKTGPKPTKQ
jgi:hypothetical protein